MNTWFIFLSETVLIFLTSRLLFKSLFTILYVFSKSQKFAITVLFIFFFPGVVVHEFSHLIMAELLQVKTHGMELFPRLHAGRLRMGSVSVSRSDFVRQFLIGVAPLVVGSVVLTISIFLLLQTFTIHDVVKTPLSFVITFFIGLFIFIITNTMFSSKKDMDGFVELGVITVVIFFAFFLFKINPYTFLLSIALQKEVLNIIVQINIVLSIPLGINIFVVGLSRVFLKRFTFF